MSDVKPALFDSATTVAKLKMGPESNAYEVITFTPNRKPGAGEQMPNVSAGVWKGLSTPKMSEQAAALLS